jgi:hypothetical protein
MYIYHHYMSLAPDSSYFQCPEVKQDYVPVKAGLQYVDCVKKKDMDVVDHVIMIGLGLARNIRPRDEQYEVSDEDVMSDPEDEEEEPALTNLRHKASSDDVTSWSVLAVEEKHYYDIFFLYPFRVFLKIPELNLMKAYRPTRIDDSHFMLLSDARTKKKVLRVRVTMSPYETHTKAAIYYFEQPPTYHIPQEGLGYQEEGQGIKRKRGNSTGTRGPAKKKARTEGGEGDTL